MKSAFCLLLIVVFVFSGLAQNNHPVSWKIITRKVDSVTYNVEMHAAVEEPYHIYPQASGGGLGMPTKIIFEPEDNIQFVGSIEEKGDEQTGTESLPHYSKGVSFIQKIKLLSAKETTLRLTIKYMACTDAMCLPPATKRFTIVLDEESDGTDERLDSLNEPVTKPIAIRYKDFKLPDTSGKEISSKDIISKNKYVFIDFWASWCVPCRAQARALLPLYDKYKSRGFEVIAVSMDTQPDAWRKAIVDDNYSWINLSDMKGFESPISQQYLITAIPRNFLLNAEGSIIASDLHGKKLVEKLAELFD